MTDFPQWFTAVGALPTAEDRTDAGAILVARGHAAVAGALVVVSWQSAADWTEHPAMAECWDDDEEEREVLWGRVAAQIGEASLLEQLTAVTSEAAPRVRAAAHAASGPAPTDQETIATAAASALLALHQYRLAQWAGTAPDHPFLRKYALFARGRWALGYRDGTYGIC